MNSEKNTDSHSNQEPAAFRPSSPAGRSKIFTRRAILFGVVFLAVVFIIFKIGRSQADSGTIRVAAQSIDSRASPRAYQFTGQGKILGGSGKTWIIGGLPVVVSDQTQLGSDIHPGETVSLLGHITKSGIWQAERIQPISDNESFFSFAGPLESRSPDVWRIGGISVTINGNTQIGESVQDNELVLVTFNILSDSTWLALSIGALSDTPEAATLPAVPTLWPPTLQPTPTATLALVTEQPPLTVPVYLKDKENKCKGNGKGLGKPHGNGRGKGHQKTPARPGGCD
jgi:hypothetical protein